VSGQQGGVFVVGEEPAQQCDGCGEIRELRPYGPGGSVVCFDCAMKDPKTAEKHFGRRLNATKPATNPENPPGGPS